MLRATLDCEYVLLICCVLCASCNAQGGIISGNMMKKDAKNAVKRKYIMGLEEGDESGGSEDEGECAGWCLLSVFGDECCFRSRSRQNPYFMWACTAFKRHVPSFYRACSRHKHNIQCANT